MNKLRMFLAVLMSVISLHAFGQEFTVDGITYSGRLNGTEYQATVSGCSPEMTEVFLPDMVMYEGVEYVVNAIAGSAFRDNVRMRKINIPDAVTEIPYGCFSGCSALEVVSISDNSLLSKLGLSAFSGCNNLKKINIPDAVTEIPNGCFSGCSALEEVGISENSLLSKLEEEAFRNCSSLQKINLPDAVTEISNSCFSVCSALEEVGVSDKSALSKLGASAFSSCSSLKKINIPDAVTEIPNSCFLGCSALEEVSISDKSALSKLGRNAFRQCSSLKKINIPDVVTEIPYYCFCDCSSLEEVSISDKSALSKLGEYAFRRCSSLTKINIPDAVTEIPNYCFDGCSVLDEVSISDKSALSKLGNGTFRSCSSLEKINIPDAVTEIPVYCFYNCSSLEEICISDKSVLSKLGESAFRLCSSLKKINIPNAVTEIPEFCFYGSGLEFCVLPDNITTISNNALSACNSLNSILFMQATPPSSMIRNLSNNIFVYVPQKNYDVYVEAGVDQYFKLIALDDEQVASYIENGEIYGDGVNDYLAVTVDDKDLYNYKATLQNNYCDELELIRCIIRDSQTMVAQANRMFYGFDKQLGSGKSKSLTQSKQDDRRYVFEWYYMYNGQLCKKSSADVVANPKFYQDKMAYSISADSVELIGATKDLELAVIPAKVTWSGKDYGIAAVSESAFANCEQLKAIVDLNGNVKTEQMKTTAPIYVADAKGNGKLKEFVNWDNAQLTYTGKTAKLGWTNNLSDFGVTAKADAQTSQTETGEYTDSIDFTFTYQKQPFAVKLPCKYTITPAPLTATVQPATKVYGTENPKFAVKYSGFVNGEAENVLTKLGEFTTEATVKSGVGDYDVTLSGVEAKNYEVKTVAGKLTVTPAKLTAKVNDAERQYGDKNPKFGLTLTGLVNGDKQEDVLANEGMFITDATETSVVGEYTVKCSGAEAKNYTVETVDGVLKVTPATLVARINAATKVYGADLPQFTARFIGFCNGETADVLTSQGTFATTATAKSDVGEYEVTMSGAKAQNYVFEYEPGTLTVTPAKLTAKADDQKRLYYGENPELTVSYEGFVNGDDERCVTVKGTLSTTATKTSNVGTYPITLSGVEAKNYDVTCQNGTLTVEKGRLTARVENATMVYGEDLPEFKIALTGMPDGVDASSLNVGGTVITAATQRSEVGEYKLQLAGTWSQQYDIETVDGTLTVTPALLTAKVQDATRPYGEENPQFTATFDGFRNGDTERVLTNKGSYSTAATKTSDVGQYEVTLSGVEAKNYIINKVEAGVLTIERAEQQIVWEQDLQALDQFAQLELTATATSGLAVSYQVTQGGEACSVVKVGQKTFLDCYGAGNVTLAAWQEGNKNYYPTLRTYKQVSVISGIGSVAQDDYTLATREGLLLIGGLQADDTVRICDLAGRLVYSGQDDRIRLARGSYLVRIGRWQRKVLVK